MSNVPSNFYFSLSKISLYWADILVNWVKSFFIPEECVCAAHYFSARLRARSLEGTVVVRGTLFAQKFKEVIQPFD